MSDVALKRWDDTVDLGMRESPDGEWVRLADVQALFTREDVAFLNDLASPPDMPPFQPLRDLAAKIAALLQTG